MTSPIHLPECETGSCVMRHETVASDVKASVRNLTHDESREDDCPDRPKENR